MANALRRIALSGTHSVAPHHVEIRRNDSVMSDEQLAHRIGQLIVRNDMVREGQVLTLRASAPVGRQRVVLSSEIGDDPAIWGQKSGILVILGPRQSIDLDVVLDRGNASSHTRYCPVEVATFGRHTTGWDVEIHSTGALDCATIVRQICTALQEQWQRAAAAVHEVS